jgi:hypothetical protein
MPNVTMSIDEELLRKAQLLAVERNTNISELFRSYLTDLTAREENRRGFVADELDRLFEKSQAASGGGSWTRGSLHER